MKLALFDFDETLIHQNSLAYLFKGVSNKRLLFPDTLSLIFKSDTYRQGIKYAIKRRLYQRCLAGVTEQQVYQAGKNAAAQLQALKPVVERLQQLHQEEHCIWIVTATPGPFIAGIVEQWGWPVNRIIGTELYQHDNVYTGSFGAECMLYEKVKRIQEVIKSEQLEVSIEVAYGNLPVDIPMMSLANKSYAVAGQQIDIFNSSEENINGSKPI